MNKQELFDRVDAFISTHGYVPVNVRVHFDKNYGLDRQTGYFIFGATPCRVDSNDIEIQSLEDAAPRVQRTIYICQDYTTCVPE